MEAERWRVVWGGAAETRWTCMGVFDEHMKDLAENIRDEDRVEIEASSGLPPLECIQRSLEWSTYARTLLLHGQVAAIYGLGPAPGQEHTGIAWAITSNVVSRHPKLFAQASREILAELLYRHPVLINAVDVRYAAAIRWLTWLGARWGAELDMGRDGEIFRVFSITRD